MADMSIHIPAGNLNNARWELDTRMIPSIFYKDPTDFIVRCRRQKDGYLCALFNRYYEIANKVFFFDDPKFFEKSQFVLTETDLDNGRTVLHLSLPDEHQGSLNYCTGYGIAFEKKLFTIRNPKFFTLERHFGGIFRLGTVDKEGNHTDLGETSGDVQKDLETIGRIAAEMDAQRLAQLQKEMQERKERKKAEKRLKK